MAFSCYAAPAHAHYLKLDFDKQKPGQYTKLDIGGVQLIARGGKPFEIRAMNRANTSPPNVLIVPVDEVVDISFDNAKIGTVTGLGATVGLLNAGPREEAVFGVSVRYPGPSQKLPAPMMPKLPSNTTQILYQPSADETQFSFQLQLGKSHSGVADGLHYHFSFGQDLGVVKDAGFDGKPGFGSLDRSGQGGGGAFFDDLSFEVSVGPATPYVLNGRHDEKVDLIFLPDQTYKNDFIKFFKELSGSLRYAFEHNDVFKKNSTKFNIYYITEAAKVNPQSTSVFDYAHPPTRWGDWGFSQSTSYRGFSDDFPFVDAVGIPVYSPYNMGGLQGGSHSQLGNGGGVFWFYGRMADVLVHEAGHGIFDLVGEYCIEADKNPGWCYFDDGKQGDPNIWPSEQDCRQAAKSNGWDPNDCEAICDKKVCYTTQQIWWKADKQCVMGQGGMQYGQACTTHIQKYLGVKP